jgi:CBS domain-containing protein
MRVRDLMQGAPAFVTATTDLRAAAARFADGGEDLLAVLGAQRRVIGVLTSRDALLALAPRDRRPSEALAGEAMRAPVVDCHPQEEVQEVLARMARHGVRRLPVTAADGSLLGLISLDAIVRHARSVATAGFPGPLDAELAETLAAICAAEKLEPVS